MKRLCKMCAGTGRLTSLDQLSRSTAPMSVPCGMCGGLGFVDDFVYRTRDADLAAENERLKAKAKHYVCIRERNRETIDDLKGKLNTSESENERLKAKLEEIKVECNKSMLVKNPLKHAGCLLLFGDKLNNILAIIDRDGDE